MYLKQISIVNFKNHREGKYNFTPEVNCFTGKNGVGKTNLLDAIYYLSFSKSFFNSIDTQNIHFNSDFFIVQGEYDKNDTVEKVYIGLKNGKKKTVKRNDKVYNRLSDHIGLFPLVMVSPADVNLITEGSEGRRKFLDGVISQFDTGFLNNLMKYNKALLQRNALLKQFGEGNFFDADSIALWNEQLAHFAQPIYDSRKQFLSDFIPVFQKYYQIVSGGDEVVGINYISHLNDGEMLPLIEQNVKADLRSQHTKIGVHKDDLEFLLDEKSVKKFGSQGQQKTFVLALKLAQFEVIKNQKGMKPIVLLDDIFDKLDSYRVKALMELVSHHNFGQIFITDTDSERIVSLFEDIDLEPHIVHVEKYQEEDVK
jgi:DNA replication and repair protein RecF